jgi:cobalt-zinc-cadmium resistance protein CzcA
VLYILFEKKNKGMNMKIPNNFIGIVLLFTGIISLPMHTLAQDSASINDVAAARILTLSEAISEAVTKNNDIKSAALQIDREKTLKKGSVNFEKTNVAFSYGQMSSVKTDNYFNITQRVEFPSVYSSQSRLASEKVKSSEHRLAVSQNNLIRDVKLAYYRLVYFLNKRALITAQDTLNNNLVKASTLRYKTGESTLLEKATSETQSQEIKNRMLQNEADISIAQVQLQTLLNVKQTILTKDSVLIKKTFELHKANNGVSNNPYLQYLQQEIQVNSKETDLQKAKKLPDFLIGYFNQSIRGIQNVNGFEQKFAGSDRFHGVQIGIAFPLLPGGFKSKINAAKISEQIAATNLKYEETNMQGELTVLLAQYNKHSNSLDYYENTALIQASLIVKNAEAGFRTGEIPYIQYQQSLALALKLRSDYLDELYQFNQATINIENILGLR